MTSLFYHTIGVNQSPDRNEQSIITVQNALKYTLQLRKSLVRDSNESPLDWTSQNDPLNKKNQQGMSEKI